MCAKKIAVVPILVVLKPNGFGFITIRLDVY